jgi:hypothetical protein
MQHKQLYGGCRNRRSSDKLRSNRRQQEHPHANRGEEAREDKSRPGRLVRNFAALLRRPPPSGFDPSVVCILSLMEYRG